jgi:hypothetical protein
VESKAEKFLEVAALSQNGSGMAKKINFGQSQAWYKVPSVTVTQKYLFVMCHFYSGK